MQNLKKINPMDFLPRLFFWIQCQDDVILISWTFKRKEKAQMSDQYSICTNFGVHIHLQNSRQLK